MKIFYLDIHDSFFLIFNKICINTKNFEIQHIKLSFQNLGKFPPLKNFL